MPWASRRGPLGIALFVGAGASIASMAALGWSSDRLGRRAYLILTVLAFGAGISGLALSWSYSALLATLVVLYCFSGLYDVGINAVAVDLEQMSGRRLMSYLHAAFSGGAMAGALGAGALRQVGMNYRLVCAVPRRRPRKPPAKFRTVSCSASQTSRC